MADEKTRTQRVSDEFRVVTGVKAAEEKKASAKKAESKKTESKK